MKILTILPVSRIQYLDEVLNAYLNQSYKGDKSLLVVVDGSTELFIRVRNKIASMPLDEALCVQSVNFGEPAVTIPQRRQRIANIHNQIRHLISEDIEWIFSIEDDSILPQNALSWLVNDIQNYPSAAMVTGVELGRWGVPYVGAWTADDILNPKKLTSLPNKTTSPDVDEIDACGLYCALIRADLYKLHQFISANGLGPDINMALEFRQCGYKNYIDWSVPVTHVTEKNGQIIRIPATESSLVINLYHLPGSNVWHAGP